MVASQPSIEREAAMSLPVLPVVTYKNCRDNAPRQSFREWPALRGGLIRHTPRPMKDGPAWSPAEYLPDQPRGNANVQAVSCFVADIDDGTPPADLRERWVAPGGSPLAFALHSSYSSTPDHPKYRVIFPLKAPVRASDWPAVHRKLTLALMGDHADPACKDASRLYYLPACPPEALETAFADMQEGEPIEPGDFPDPPAEEVAEAQMRRAFRSSPPPSAGFESGGGNKPGDDFNLRGDVLALLLAHGWQEVGGRGGMVLLRRPGKGDDHSATFGYDGTRMFYCFSSSAAPFEANTGYSPFGVYALLEHGGDFREAAKKLGGDGYGGALTPAVKSRTPGWSREGGEEAASPPEAWEPPTLFTSHALPPFPLEALPDALAGFVSEVAASTQVPADLPAMIALSVIAAAGARRFVVQVGETHTEPLNLYLAVVMEPGSRKSATMDALKKPLEDAQREMAAASQSDIAARAEIRGVEDKRLGFLRDQAAKAKDPAERETLMQELTEQATSLTEVPAPARLLADDVTPEKLASLMAEQGGTMALLSAEGGIFGILAGRYSDGSANLDLFLKGHAGESVRVDRQGRPSVHIDRACLTMGLTVQPDVLTSLADTPSFRGRGLLGRFLYSLPEDLVGTRFYQNRAADPAARRRYEAVVHALLALPPASLEDPAARYPLLLSGTALDLWAEFANDAERRQALDGDLAGIRDWASKLAGEVARIAGGLHLARHAHHPQPYSLPLSEETIASAWAIGEYLIPHALAAFGQMGVSADMALARRILKWIQRRGLTEFSLRDCHQSHRSVSSPNDLLPALSLLTGRGYLRLKALPSKQGPGQPKSPEYEVNPLTQNTQNTQN